MRIRPAIQPPSAVSAPWLGLGLHDDVPESLDALGGTSLREQLRRALADKDLPTGLGDATPVLGAADLTVGGLMVFGLGPRSRFDAGAAFAAGVAISKRLASRPREAIALVVPESCRTVELASAFLEGAVVGTRGPDLRKSEAARHPFGELIAVAPPDGPLSPADLETAARRAEVIGGSINLARDLINTPPSEKAPTRLANQFREVGEAAGLTVEVWAEDQLRRERLGGLLGVAAGSAEAPALVRLEYRRGGDRPTLALVGKGVTFDSGGLSLKPSTSMEDMKADMSGAAIVMATMQAAARLDLPANLVGFVPLTENMTGGRALKLGDVLTIRNGKTVEVLNTDAEGRLILADALCLAVESQPARILDLATLTGACLVALGTKVAGLFSNDDPFASDVLAACRRTGERVWRLPLDDDYRDALKSSVADLKNIGSKWGGAVTAAKFLETFVGSTPWVHLDIAGPAWADSDSATRDTGGTGCFVRTLVSLIEATSRPEGTNS